MRKLTDKESLIAEWKRYLLSIMDIRWEKIVLKINSKLEIINKTPKISSLSQILGYILTQNI